MSVNFTRKKMRTYQHSIICICIKEKRSVRGEKRVRIGEVEREEKCEKLFVLDAIPRLSVKKSWVLQNADNKRGTMG